MTIKITPNGITCIIPDEGMAVTDGQTIAEDVVYLGKNDAPERWRDCEKPDEPQPQDTEATLEDALEKLRELGADV